MLHGESLLGHWAVGSRIAGGRPAKDATIVASPERSPFDPVLHQERVVICGQLVHPDERAQAGGAGCRVVRRRRLYVGSYPGPAFLQPRPVLHTLHAVGAVLPKPALVTLAEAEIALAVTCMEEERSAFI